VRGRFPFRKPSRHRKVGESLLTSGNDGAGKEVKMARAVEFHWDSFDRKSDLTDPAVVKRIKDDHGEDNVQLFLLDNGGVIQEIYFHGRLEEDAYSDPAVKGEVDEEYGGDLYSFLESEQVPFQNPELVTLNQLNKLIEEAGLKSFKPHYRPSAGEVS
jgi:hypothetical protein